MDFGLNYTCKNIYSNTKPDNILIIVHDKLDYSTSLCFVVFRNFHTNQLQRILS